jgi:dihydroxyacid dehydratase/phosphogluconate dehydratase
MTGRDGKRLRSQAWWNNPDNPGMTAQYLERFLNYGLTREELQGGRPIIGIAQTGSDLVPCNRHHLALAGRVRDGIRDAGSLFTRRKFRSTSNAAHFGVAFLHEKTNSGGLRASISSASALRLKMRRLSTMTGAPAHP